MACCVAAVQVVDMYLGDAHEKERVHILELVKKGDSESTELLRGYVREAMREYLVSSHQHVAELLMSIWG